VQYGREEQEWDALTSAGLEFLIRHARLQRPTSYTELNAVLARRTGLRPFEFDRERDRAGMGHLLGLIVNRNRPQTGLMISAIVNYIDDNKPGEGFYTFAKELGLLHRGASEPEKADFWMVQMTAVFKYYAPNEARNSSSGVA
jgi:hypothetical protein